LQTFFFSVELILHQVIHDELKKFASHAASLADASSSKVRFPPFTFTNVQRSTDFARLLLSKLEVRHR
jgi:hypothetical protein